MEIRGQRLSVELPHHQRDLTSMVGGMVRQMLHQVRQSDLCFCEKAAFFPRDRLKISDSQTRFVLPRLPPTVTATLARLGNASGSNRMPRLVLKSVKNAGLGDGSFFNTQAKAMRLQMMCRSVSRTERKLPPRSRVNCSAVSTETGLARPCCWPSGRGPVEQLNSHL